MIAVETLAPVEVEPSPHLHAVEPEAYQQATCPLCLGRLQQRRAGLWCPRDRGWLVEEPRAGRLVCALWQGRL